MDEKLVGAISSGVVCVAATERLAGAVRRGYDAFMASGGAKCWPSPKVLTWETWVRGFWEERWQPRTVIHPLAARVLWEEIIAADAASSGNPLLDVAATASAAMEAEELAALYLIEPDGGFDSDMECAAFRRWHGEFKKALAARGWVAGERLDAEVAALVRKGEVAAPATLILYGFDEQPPPAKGALLRALEERGTKVEEFSPPPIVVKAGRFEAADPEAEVRSAALWAGEALEENPDLFIGIVAVRLEEVRTQVERIFPALLTPLATLGGDGLERPPWDLSLGGPLAEEPVAAAALALFTVCAGEADLHDWRKLLVSPFGVAGAEGYSNVSLARLLPGLGRKRLALADLVWELEQGRLSGAAGACALAARLGRLYETADVRVEKAPSEWALRFAEALDAAGWCKAVKLSSREYQAAEKVRGLLAALNVLDPVMPRCDWGWAVERLQAMAAAPFRPKVVDASIHIMGMLEAAGMEFDRLWVLGAGDRSLPPESRANPFIPFESQVRAGLRQVTPGETLARAKRIVERLRTSASEVVFSSPSMVEGAPCGPSPLIGQLELCEPRFMEDYSLAAQIRRGGRTVLEAGFDRAKPLDAGEEARGGSRLFAWQAQCPFRAYVGLRLGVEAEREVEEGLDRGLQGTMLHLALKALHSRFPDHDSIAGASESEIGAVLDYAVQEGVEGARGKGPGEATLRVEAARMRETLHGWLAVEARRPDFRVLEREAVKRLVIGAVKVKLQVDRLDLVEGGELVIDYKTSSAIPSVASLLGGRLTEPQLPLYALACEDSAGVAYALMERGGCKLSGIAETEAGPDVKARRDWPELKEFWRGKLEGLAREFEEGRADPDPGGKREFCLFCGLDPVCRLSDDQGRGEEQK